MVKNIFFFDVEQSNLPRFPAKLKNWSLIQVGKCVELSLAEWASNISVCCIQSLLSNLQALATAVRRTCTFKWGVPSSLKVQKCFMLDILELPFREQAF